MKTNQNTGGYFWLAFAALNFVLLVAACALGFVSFFASLEIALALGAQVIWQSMGDTVQAKYTLVTLRNLWLLLGGMVLLGVIIFCINRFFKHWRDECLQRAYLALLAAEALVILAAQALTAA